MLLTVPGDLSVLSPFNIITAASDRYYYYHFYITDEENENQRSEVIRAILHFVIKLYLSSDSKPPSTHTKKKQKQKHTQLLLKGFKKGLKQCILHESAQNTNTHQCSKIPIRHYLFINSRCETKPVFFLNNEKIHTYCIFFLRLNLTTQ